MLRKLDEMIRKGVDNKVTVAAAALIFILSLIPIFYLAGINCATGDDLGYGTLTRAVWTETHSLVQVVKAAAETVKGYYDSWQGTWFTVFLFALQPAVFSSKAYVIVPFLILFLWSASTLLLVHYLMKKVLGYSGAAAVLTGILLMMAGIAYVPSTKSAIFWYNGTAHYMIPYALVFVTFYFCLRFCREGGKGAFAGMLIGMSLSGGANYQAALLIFLLCGLVVIVTFFGEHRKRALLSLIPLGAELIGLAVSMLSPGNKARGGEEFGFSVGKAVTVVLQCFVQAGLDAVGYITEHPLLLLFLFCLFLVVFYGARGRDWNYPLPFLTVVLAYCIYSAMYAPQIYAAVEVSGGVGNMNYLVFLLMVCTDIIYLTGWWNRKRRTDRKTSGNSDRCKGIADEARYGLPVLFLITSAIILVAFRGDLKNTTQWQCIEYVRSGEAENFAAQMELYRQVLTDETIADVILPEVNDRQGPLMHMPLTGEPDAWTNRITREYYGKKSVIAVPKEEWEELHR